MWCRGDEGVNPMVVVMPVVTSAFHMFWVESVVFVARYA